MKRRVLAVVLAAGILASFFGVAFAEESSTPTCKNTKPFCYNSLVTPNLETLRSVSMPKIATPQWLAQQSAPAPTTRQVTYSVSTIGNITADVDEFKSQAGETLNSSLGWSRLGVQFVRVETGGDFTLWLSEDVQVPSFSQSGCDSTYSCAVGRNVIVNQTRWLNGSPSWNDAGGSLRDYRSMVINHETGHWLGHGHRYCSGAGQPAPLMQQQSMDMQGCTPNPWPLAGELYAPNLGIRS